MLMDMLVAQRTIIECCPIDSPSLWSLLHTRSTVKQCLHCFACLVLTSIIVYFISFITLSIFVFQHWSYGWQALPSYDWVASSLSLMHVSKVHLDLLAPNSNGTNWKEQIKIFINYAELMVELSQCYHPSLYLAAECSPSPWSFIVKEPKKKIVSQKVIIKYNLSPTT